MLIEFRVANFRSIREEQTLSMVAAKDKSHVATHLSPTGVRAIPNLVRCAVIYGANAAGKSNMTAAFAFMREIVATSATRLVEGQRLNCQPFRLDKESAGAPSEFEVTFLIDGVRHQYGFKLTGERVLEEWLLVYRAPKPQQWFRRRFDATSGKDVYEFSVHLTGKRKLWEESTRANALFLSTATQLNSELLRPVFLWITKSTAVVAAGMQPAFDFTLTMAKEAVGKSELLRFLEAADLSIIDLSLELRKVQEVGLVFEPGKIPAKSVTEVERPFVRFVHKSDDDALASFELHEESLGTQRLFAFAGPILDVLRHGRVLVVDELDGSLHPLMVRYLVNLFHSELNQCGAQLIFTTHDTSLLDKDLFRRDQVWFVEKERTQATRLYPMTDFSPRKNEALERGYLAGRYGALPFLSEMRS